MRTFTIILMLIFSQFSNLAQKKTDIKLQLDNNGKLQFELQLKDQKIQLDNYQKWIHSIDHSITGEIIRVNSKEFIYKGKRLVYLSKKPSTFQTEILFTLNISHNAKGTQLTLNNIYYKSLPEYGKQGTPAIITDCSDWFSHKKLYKKSGKMRTLNQNLMHNSTAFAEELLLSCLD